MASKILNPNNLPDSRIGKVGIGGAAFGVVASSYTRLRAGESFGTALTKGVAESALYAVAPTAMLFGQLGFMGARAGAKALTQKTRREVSTGPNFSYMDTQAAMTMRQASVQAIQGSKLNARNALGGEAALMHRGYKR